MPTIKAARPKEKASRRGGTAPRTGASEELARKVLRQLGSRGEAMSVEQPRGKTARYVRLQDADGKTVAYIQARSRSAHEIALTRGRTEAIAEALPEGRDAYTRRFTRVSEAARGLRAALEEDAPGRRRRYV